VTTNNNGPVGILYTTLNEVVPSTTTKTVVIDAILNEAPLQLR